VNGGDVSGDCVHVHGLGRGLVTNVEVEIGRDVTLFLREAGSAGPTDTCGRGAVEIKN
jgi:hypothetical protein